MSSLDPLEHVSMLGSLFTTQGVILLGMAVVAILIISLFVPGGPKRIFAIIAIIATAGVGAYFLSKRNNKMVDDYNKLLQEYQSTQAQSELANEKVSALMQQNKLLKQEAGKQQADMEQHMAEYQQAKLSSAELAAKQAALASSIEIKTQKLESGYQPGTAAALREQWETMKKPSQVVSAPTAPAQSVPDLETLKTATNYAIDIVVNGFRLMGM